MTDSPVMRSRATRDRAAYRSAMRGLAAMARLEGVDLVVVRQEVRARIVGEGMAPHVAAHSLLADWQDGAWPDPAAQHVLELRRLEGKSS